MNFRDLCTIRDGVPQDRNFILATFLRGLYYGDSWFSLIPKDIFMDNYKHLITSIVDHDQTVVKVACLPDDPSVIIGYSILSPDFQTVHWVYVKSAWRNKGLGRALVPNHPTYVSHLTELGKILLPKLEGAVFNPFSLGEP